jgi:ankyrin repeat protein
MSHITSFFQAVPAGDARRVKALLDSHASLATAKSEKGQSALLTAVYSGRKEIRDLLLARGVELELHEAVAAGQLERVKQIVGAGEKQFARRFSYLRPARSLWSFRSCRVPARKRLERECRRYQRNRLQRADGSGH